MQPGTPRSLWSLRPLGLTSQFQFQFQFQFLRRKTRGKRRAEEREREGERGREREREGEKREGVSTAATGADDFFKETKWFSCIDR